MPSSETQLSAWISEQLQQRDDISLDGLLRLDALAGDAGFRQYFRLNTQPALLAVMAPKTDGLSECARYFAHLSASLRDAGVATPQIIAYHEDDNFLLIEDFGSQSYLDVLSADSVEVLYGQALMMLLRLQQVPKEAAALPTYDRSLLRQEMMLFDEWFVESLLSYSLSQEEHALLDRTYSFLEQQALSQPQVVVHRDYHSRNLMFREGEAPGVIDFQDAVWGPVSYDVVSLLRDCYIRWSPEQVKRWSLTFANLAAETGIIDPVSDAQWQQWFDTMGLQRHIKVLGIFARLALRDGKKRYLDDLPLVWRYIMDVASLYPEMRPFSEWCQSALLPLVKQQSWYRDRDLEGNNLERAALEGKAIERNKTENCA